MKKAKGYIMIPVLLALWYIIKETTFLNSFTDNQKTLIIVGGALFIYLCVEILFGIKEKGVKATLVDNIPIIVGGVLIVIISLLLNNTNVPLWVTLVIWFAIFLGATLIANGVIPAIRKKLKGKRDEE